MKICIYAEPLKVMTSANPARGMLKNLLKLRSSDSFVFVIRRGSENSSLLKQFFESCNSDNWSLLVDSRLGKIVNLQALLQLENYAFIKEQADVYLNMDLDYLGPHATPLITTVADLSTIRCPKLSSLSWYGVRIRQHAIRTMAKYASQVIAISNFTKQDLEQYDPSLQGRVTVVHSGIDDDWRKATETDPILLPTNLRLTRPYWIWWGHITKRKNIDGLLRAYAKLLSLAQDEWQIPDLLLVGSISNSSKNLPELIKTLGISERVQIQPSQPLDYLISLVRQSMGLLFPSHYEGFGLPVIEAMTQGKPVLVSNKAALPEVAGGLGVVCDPNNLEDLCRAMLEMLKDHQHKDGAIAARKQWAANFTHHISAQKYSQVITNLAGG
jgi:glycosyltransferase involved in cell wall biosynthesis